MILNKKSKGFTVLESLITLGFFTIVFVIFIQVVYSVQKTSAIVNKQIDLRTNNIIVDSSIETNLRRAFYLFSRDNMEASASIPAFLYNDDNDFLTEFENLPQNNAPAGSDNEPGNVIYFLTQEIKPLSELVNNMNISNTSGLSTNAALVVDTLGIPTPVKESKIRTLELHIIYLKKQVQDRNNPKNKGALKLIHAKSVYKIYHKSNNSASGTKTEGGIIWPDNYLTSSQTGIMYTLTGGDSNKTSDIYRNIAYKLLELNGFLGWEKPEETEATSLPLPASASSQYFTLRTLSNNIGLKERISMNPNSDQFDDLPTNKGDLENKKDIFGVSFQYFNRTSEADELSGETGDKISKIVKVNVYTSEYDSTAKHVLTNKSVINIVPRNTRKL